MAKRKQSGRLDVGKEARRQARVVVGTPPRERVIPDKRKRPPKHKKRQLEEE